MKLLKNCLLILLLVFTGLIAYFWTPDTSFKDMRTKYAAEPSQFIDLGDEQRLHFRDQGRKDAPVLVLIHGTSASLHTWEPLVSRLSANFRLVSFDLPGHGLTGSNSARDYSHKAMVSAIWVVMDHLNIDSATMVGNSLGGAIAWKSALDQAKRVRSLVLLAPSGAPRLAPSKSNIGFKILGTSIGQAIMKKISPKAIIAKSLEQTVYDPSLISSEMVDRYWELLRLKGNRQAMIDLANTSRDGQAWKGLNKIRAPALVIWGEQDGLLPVSMSDTFEREMPNADIVRLENIGHLPMEEDVEKVAELIIQFCSVNNC